MMTQVQENVQPAHGRRSAALRAPLAVGLMGVLLIGCGGFSNEEALFLGSLPRAEEVRLQVDSGAGQQSTALTTQQALGDAATTYLQLSEIAAGLNASVDQTLEFVHNLGRDDRPRWRTAGQRVWGPVSNVEGLGFTMRLEISRLPTSAETDAAPRFFICLQVAKDQDYTGGQGSCQGGDDAGLRPLLWGTYGLEAVDPDAAGRAGSGEIFINLGRLQRLEGGTGGGGLYRLRYSFSAGGLSKAIEIDISSTGANVLGGARRTATYVYGLNNDCVDFYLRFLDNLQGSGPLLETHTFTGNWTLAGAGQTELLIAGGDLALAFSASVRECWDTQQRRTYLSFLPELSAEKRQEGTIDDCPQTCGP